MAFSVTIKCWVFAVALLYVSVFGIKFGMADEEQPQAGGSDGAQSGEIDDPAQIVAKAILCFNDKFIYISCEEEFRLNENGNLDVPRDHTDQFCSGPCLTETHLVLNCIDDIFTKFLFYNKATIQDIRDTIKAACSNTNERGNFNVAEHIKSEENKANKAANYAFLFGLVVLIIGRGLFS